MAHTRHLGTSRSIPLGSLPGAALRAVVAEGYGISAFKRDALAGLVVGVVALPLSMALAIAVGVPPQHGLYTAIIAGFVCALLGGSRTQVTGPTAAFIVILAPIYAKFGAAGLLVSGLLGGLILVAMGLLRLGRLIQFIPHPVTTGFTAGIATVIASMQLKDLLGLQVAGKPEHFADKLLAMFAARGSASRWEFLIGAGTLGLLLVLPRLTRRFPAPLVALPLAALVAWVLARFVPGFHVATIAERFHTEVDGSVV
ncbi:MAG: C4-dicarboxylic acid transporter DauA, partial [Myxococcales bacterium]|nr:C4-dicarboxylic acid transporter DauA [Myxococcales bacterium]